MKYFNLYAKFSFLYFISIPSNHSLFRFWFYLRYKKYKYVLFYFYFAKFNFLHLISTSSNCSPTCIWFYLRYKIRKIIQSSVLSFPDVFEGSEFPPSFSLLSFPCILYCWVENLLPGFSTNYAKFFCLFLLWLCINVLHDVGECCESVPLDCTGSYVSISINIAKILACVVQVDAFIISL